MVPKQCYALNTDMCKDLGYTLVQMPNIFKHKTQNLAKERIREFYPLVLTKCSPVLRFFLCTLYIPPCVSNVNELILPCREVCEEARRGCEPIMLRAGFNWPDAMKCTPKFPLNRSGFCFKPRPNNTKGELHVIYSFKVMSVLLSKLAGKERKCYLRINAVKFSFYKLFHQRKNTAINATA